MKALQLTLFDDTLSGTSATWYSPSQFNDELGKHDVIAIAAAVTEVSGSSPTLSVAVEGSSDGEHWVPTGAGGNPNISTVISANNTYFASTGMAVLPAFIRLSATLGGTGPACRLKLSVTCRDF